MAYPDQRKHTNQHSAGYLDETEKQLLNAGLPEYYSHIVSLYDKERIHSYVIDFSRLALQFIKPSSPSSSSLSSTDALRTEMHSRLFFAALHTSRFDLAHSTLSLISDSALQTSSLRSLITKMCEANHASQLVALPFIGLQDQVDDILAQKCRAVVEVATGIPWHKVLTAISAAPQPWDGKGWGN
ncbi:dna repair rad51 protein [Rutstroemia sp. NJR-2017a BBW]|nr:dna repair rad51 protein [Rutstroemia sp. NJR-2017a BBW]